MNQVPPPTGDAPCARDACSPFCSGRADHEPVRSTFGGSHAGKLDEISSKIWEIVVIADFVFIATALVGQPVTGMLLADAPRPERYHPLYRRWFAFGFPAFAAVLAIFWLMIARPEVAL